MSSKTFNINTVPHEAKIGNDVLYFIPEVIGTDFMTGYSELSAVTKAASDKGDDARPEDYAKLSAAMREFLSKLMLPKSVTAFADMVLPDRVLVQLIEWSAELYGGGSGKAGNTGPSSGS